MSLQGDKKGRLLTENSQVGFGRSDRHGEQRAGVHAFVGQQDVADADGQLRPRGVDQLDPVVPQRWREGGRERRETNDCNRAHFCREDISKSPRDRRIFKFTSPVKQASERQLIKAMIDPAFHNTTPEFFILA